MAPQFQVLRLTLFAQAHPNSSLINGVVCCVRVQERVDPLMQKIRYLDKLINELAKGRAMEKILRWSGAGGMRGSRYSTAPM